MLQLKSIKKDYSAGSGKVHALKGIDINFRKCEFVSVLGPSGCGKTTLLNIIGGLDRYTSGELRIDGVSTEKYTDRDWDTYRNHRVGFIFQSYNLIPHQTILGNVELALNISGVEKSERTMRAKAALDQVGLKDLYAKKPNQLSGGQCQRVAIARALVNEPEILLADEPTGALDSETSVQIMELIKEISLDRLVIMVTHNPELAERYSTRIVRLLDGNIVSDTAPYDGEAEEPAADSKPAKPEKTIAKKSKLSFWSAFGLSANNLRTKFKRTLLVCLAGAIGIIGVASVLGVSNGVQNYITDMQNDMLSGNPVTISETSFNLSMLMSQTNAQTQREAVKNAMEDGYINVNSMIDYLVSRYGDSSSLAVTNDITREYVDYVRSMPEEYYAAIAFDYGIDVSNNLYTDYELSGGTEVISIAAASRIMTAMLSQTDIGDYSSLISSFSEEFMQAPDNEDFILSQYEFVAGDHIATAADEIMIVVNDERELSDLLLAQFGYFSQDEFFNAVYKATGDERYQPALDKTKFSYEELLGKTFTYYPNDTVYSKTSEHSPLASVNPFTYNAYASESWDTGKELTVTAILKVKDGISYGCLESGFYYTARFAEEVLSEGMQSEIVQYLNDNEKGAFTSGVYNGVNMGITFDFSYIYEGTPYSGTGFVGSMSSMNALLNQTIGSASADYYTLSLRALGGSSLPETISIYPTDFNYKDNITEYLGAWNSDADITVNGVVLTAEDRAEINYTDNLVIVISLINNMIDIVTSALVAFTCLSLVVSTVMIAIITYVSVIERIKEIGVIRSLGGRKKDVSRLFTAETFIIGLISGLIGIIITYAICGVINLVLGSLFGISAIANLTASTALVMIAVSVALTLISGLIPARLAAKKDPVEALRSE